MALRASSESPAMIASTMARCSAAPARGGRGRLLRDGGCGRGGCAVPCSSPARCVHCARHRRSPGRGAAPRRRNTRGAVALGEQVGRRRSSSRRRLEHLRVAAAGREGGRACPRERAGPRRARSRRSRSRPRLTTRPRAPATRPAHPPAEPRVPRGPGCGRRRAVRLGLLDLGQHRAGLEPPVEDVAPQPLQRAVAHRPHGYRSYA